jgi:membrane protease YdiL (CAAX protease family)
MIHKTRGQQTELRNSRLVLVPFIEQKPRESSEAHEAKNSVIVLCDRAEEKMAVNLAKAGATSVNSKGIENRTPYFGTGTVLLLYLLMILTVDAVAAIQQWLFGAQSLHKYWYLPSPIAILPIAFLIVFRHRSLLGLSGWRPRWVDFLIGVPLGVLGAAIPLFFVSTPIQGVGSALPRGSIIPIVVVMPFLEEIIYRGVFLKSLKTRLPRGESVLIVTLLAAFGDSSFWIGLPGQFILSVVYVSLGDSLAASILGHIASNAFVYLPVAGFFERWHIYPLWK